MDLGQLHQKVVTVVDKAEKRFLEGFFGEFAVDFKGEDAHSYSIVTEVDRALDSMLHEELVALLPGSGWVSEETDTNQAGEWSWIVDPIDGTLNFSKRIPVCGISIALWQGDEPRYGIVAYPLQKERIHAIHGQGAYINGVRVQGAGRVSPRDPYWYCSYYLEENQDKLPLLVARMGTPSRRLDCASYELALTGIGRAQGCLLGGQAVWDIGAAVLIAQECGRKVRYLARPPHLSGPNSRSYNQIVATGDDAFMASVDAVML
jgi:myo-inositol-1(or 4)-monophosphatase